MDRSSYPENVEVHQAHLEFTESSKAEQLLRRWNDAGQGGVVTGLVVSATSPTSTSVLVSAGHGYAPNGELVEVPLALGPLALTNYAVGVDNYICLVYTETESHPEAAATGGRTRTTRAVRSYRTAVYTLAELNGLPATSSDLSLDATDRVLVVGVVNANGVGVVLTSADITTSSAFTTILSMEQPSVMTGVEVVSLDPLTETTAARLLAGDSAADAAAKLKMIVTFAHPSPPSSITLAYKAPGDSTYGSATVVNGGGSPFTIASSGGRTIVVGVAIVALPSSGFPSSPATIEETFTVSEVYSETVARAGARDEFHRHEMGAVIPAASNPHGLKAKNLGGAQQELRGTSFLGTGLEATFAQTLVPRLYTNAPAIISGAEVTERVFLWHIVLTNSGTPLVVRFYGASSTGLGTAGLEISINARWMHNASTGSKLWIADDTTFPAALFQVAANSGPDAGVNVLSRASTVGSWADSGWTYTLATSALLNRVAMTGEALLGTGNLTTTGGIHTPRVNAPYSVTAGMRNTLIWRSAPSVLTSETTTRLHVMNGTCNLTVNARWDQTLFAGAGGWVADQAASPSTLITITGASITHFSKDAGAAPWTEFAWDQVTKSSGGAVGLLTHAGDVAQTTGTVGYTAQGTGAGYRISNSTGEFHYLAARAGSVAISPTQAGTSQITTDPYLPFADGSLRKTGGTGTARAFWTITAPNAATIKNFRVTGTIFAGAGTLIEAFRRSRTPSSVAVSSLSGGPVPLLGVFDLSIPVDQNNLVDNQLYVYYLLLTSAIADVVEIDFINFDWESTILRP